MTETAASPRPGRAPSAGERVLVLEAVTIATGGVSWRDPGGYVAQRGDVLVITSEMLAASRDRNGDSPWDLLHDEEAQIEKWGVARYRFLHDDEDVPEEYTRPAPGSPEAAAEFDRVHLAIVSDRAMPEAERIRRLREARALYRPPSSQRTTYVRGNSGDPALDRPRRADREGR